MNNFFLTSVLRGKRIMAENTLITERLVVVPQTSANHTGTVVFLHGSGDSGVGVSEWVKTLSNFTFPHIRVLYPTAPERPYSLNGGLPSNVWFDRLKLSIDAKEQLDSLDATAKELVNIVKQEMSLGIPINNIVIGGFSMGGGMSLHLGYRYLPRVAGVFALSSFLSNSSPVYETLAKNNSNEAAPLFMAHGTADDLIPKKWGHETYCNITKYGIVGKFNELPNVNHELTSTELNSLKSWIMQIIPEPNAN